MSWGPDEAFRAAFGEEAEARLSRLTDSLARLEVDPPVGERRAGGATGELLTLLRRDVHTLRGAAAVVGADAMARVAHVVEHLLDEARSGGIATDADLVARLRLGVNGLRGMLPTVLAGVDAGPEADDLIGALSTAAAPDAPPPTSAVAPNLEVPPQSAVPLPPQSTVPSGPPPEAEVGAIDALAADDFFDLSHERIDVLTGLVGEMGAGFRRIAALVGRLQGGSVPSEVVSFGRLVADLHHAVLQARMAPVGRLLAALEDATRVAARSSVKRVRVIVHGESTECDQAVLDGVFEPLLYLVRSAVDRGVEPPDRRAATGKSDVAVVTVRATRRGATVVLEVGDDGDERDTGADLELVRAALRPVRGTVEVADLPGHGTTFRIVVPVTLSILSCVVVAAGGRVVAVPADVVVQVLDGSGREQSVEGRPALRSGGELVTVDPLAAVLGVRAPRGGHPVTGEVLVVSGGGLRQGFRIDGVLSHRDVVVKPVNALVGEIDVLIGVGLEADGSLLPVLDAERLVARARAMSTGGRA